jgi:Raf kinase inhibitor-like YbhB/YbcL family protein
MHHRDAGTSPVWLVLPVVFLVPLNVGCSSGGDADGGAPATQGGSGGGNANTGGSRGTGGSGGASTGGTSGSGGTSGTGGSGSGSGSGGTQASGGAPGATGGSSGTGGSGTGGSVADAAAPETGGGDAPVGTGPIMLTSTAFAEGGDVAKKYRCKTENVSPPLAWTPGPAGTLSYAVTMYHAKSVHWMMWDIPANVTSLPEGIMRLAEPPIPAGAKQVKPAVDGSTWYGYSGPCPGSPNQSYQYYLYALKVAKLPVTTESSPTAIDAALQTAKLERAQLVGTASP